MSEYYIRREGDEDASGPYNMDQITSLFEAGKIDPNVFYYDIEQEIWRPISENKGMMDVLVPQKKKLSLRIPGKEPEPEEKPQSEETGESDAATDSAEGEPDADDEKPKTADVAEPEPEEEEQPESQAVSVTTMLAHAQGRESDDPSEKSPAEKRALAAFVGLRACTALLFVSAAAMALLEKDLILSANAINMAQSPYLILGGLDLLLGLFLLLQVTELYPIVRYKAALNMGLLSVFFLASGDHILIACNALLMTAIYFSTALLHLSKVILAAILGVVSIAGYAYVLLAAQV